MSTTSTKRKPPPQATPLKKGQVEKRDVQVSLRIPIYLRERVRWFAGVLEDERPGERITEALAHRVLLQRALAVETANVFGEMQELSCTSLQVTESLAPPIPDAKDGAR